MEKATYRHVLLTRFNVRQWSGWSDLVTNPRWLQRRFELFDAFCYPSVRGQTADNFVWIVFFDDQTPEEFRQRIERYAQWPVFRPVFLPWPPESVNAIVQEHLDDEPQYLITTRLDNDDAICKDFLERVQQQFDQQRRQAINFESGYIWKDGRIYLCRDRSSPFASLIERYDEFRTVWCRPHLFLNDVAPVRQITGEPAWIQVVHRDNVHNRVRGHRRPWWELNGDFSLRSDISAKRDHPVGYLADRCVLDGVRAAREVGIRLARPMLRECAV